MKRSVMIVLAVLSLCACQRTPPPPAAATPGHAQLEAALPTVQLSARAIERLQLQTSRVEAGSVPRTRLVGGEVVVPPGRSHSVTAPVAGEVSFVAGEPPMPGTSVQRGAAILRLHALAPVDRDTRARAQRELAAAQANAAALEQRVVRNKALVDERSGSARALEEAIAARDVAAADLAAARARAATLAHDPLLSDVAMLVRSPSSGVIRLLAVAEGQAVAPGAALFEVASVEGLQVRVPVFSGDVARLDTRLSARVRSAERQSPVEARFVPGPPTAEPDRSTVDRYLLLPAAAGFAPGQRVLVELPLAGASSALTIPASAMLLDAWGGAWVYQCDGERFSRARVDPVRRVGDKIALASGPPAGACIVSVGAVELFGTEFPPGH